MSQPRGFASPTISLYDQTLWQAWGNMFKILHAEFLAPGIKRFVIEAPRIARKQKPGSS
jgi:hypothetical protein